MADFKETIQQIVTTGLKDVSVDVDIEGRRITIFDSHMESKEALPKLISELEIVLNLVAKRHSLNTFIVDINNYRREREHLITELAKAAARKVLVQKKEVALPAMNGYERRLVHMELASRPDVKTESVGEGKERCVIIKPL
ncbi:MAG TPA: R3H domain-containing nucleic acid-binding protein [Candidatus Paceibacterota bacterium]